MGQFNAQTCMMPLSQDANSNSNSYKPKWHRRRAQAKSALRLGGNHTHEVLGFVVGAFGELSPAFHELASAISPPNMLWRANHTKPDPKSMRVMPLCSLLIWGV